MSKCLCERNGAKLVESEVEGGVLTCKYEDGVSVSCPKDSMFTCPEPDSNMAVAMNTNEECVRVIQPPKFEIDYPHPEPRGYYGSWVGYHHHHE